METTIKIKEQYNNLNALNEFFKKEVTFDSSVTYDTWEMRTDINGKMEQCVVLKKSNMHAVKLYFSNVNTVKVNYIIPNKIMNAYFGKSVKMRRSIIDIIAEQIKELALKGSQKKAFEELLNEVEKIAS